MSRPNATVLDAARELELIARAQKGEERAFEALFDAYRRRVYGLCLRMSGSATEAEDLTQDAFLRVFRKLSTFRGESMFSTWLHRLVINVVLTYLRSERSREVSSGEADWDKEGGAAPLPSSRQTAEEWIDRIALDKAIAGLPPEQRTVLVLHDVEEREHGEIAQIMDCSIARSRSLLHRARLRLRRRLSEERRSRLAPQPAEMDCSKTSRRNCWAQTVA